MQNSKPQIDPDQKKVLDSQEAYRKSVHDAQEKLANAKTKEERNAAATALNALNVRDVRVEIEK